MENSCSVSGCNDKVKVLGKRGLSEHPLCGRHYQRLRKHGNVEHNSFFVQEAECLPTQEFVLWASGFIEGEGHFRTSDNCPRVVVNQVQRWPLEKLLHFFGGSLRLQQHDKWHSDIWIWTAHGDKARFVLDLIYEHMSPRRQEQIRNALQQGE